MERLTYYSNELPTEADSATKFALSADWPAEGKIELKNLNLKYDEHLPLVLSGVSLTILPGEKIGVVGRTGSGKSSLMLALYRIIEPCGGSILIDGVDTKSLGLRDLRTRMAIIPQDPVLFNGSVRFNLDPFDQHTDEEIWSCIERSGIKHVVFAMEDGLDSPIATGGENLSIGQRQLFCLARALIKESKIVILDECTANVDMETDEMVQKCLRTDFAKSTVLAIAHRLDTIMDYDRILLLDHGSVVEFDSPTNLLQRQDSAFHKLYRESHTIK